MDQGGRRLLQRTAEEKVNSKNAFVARSKDVNFVRQRIKVGCPDNLWSYTVEKKNSSGLTEVGKRREDIWEVFIQR